MATASSSPSSQEAYDDLKRLTPLLAAELDHLRASLREHNLWLQRYGQSQGSSSSSSSHDAAITATTAAGATTGATSTTIPEALPPPAQYSTVASLPPPPPHPALGGPEPQSEAGSHPSQTSTDLPPPPHTSSAAPNTETNATHRTASNTAPNTSSNTEPPPQFHPPTSPSSRATPGGPDAFPETSTPAAAANASPPPYSASDVPGYSRSDSSSPAAVRYEVAQRRDQLMEWLKEGEDLLRDYSARYAQLAEELHLPAEDVLGTWNEAASDNALPGYRMVESREELMVGNVGEVPPNYVQSPGR